MQRILFIIILSIASLWAQIPNGYYDSASDLTGDALQQALHDIINNHTSVTYTALWTHFQTTDVKSNGKVWDMYSDVPGGTPAYEYTFVTDQCGNYSGEGSCYNREHSWPKSWFNKALPMNTDLFHLVPTDGYVNGRRSNYPYGEVSNSTWASTNGSKLGPNTTAGYSGTVFEPIDEYKGDFARNYFYMSTRYLNEDSSWDTNDMVIGAQLKSWALNMMLGWHAADTVSQKEIDRNNAIYAIQQNRNPYVDHPGYTNLIWGGTYPVSIDIEQVALPHGLVLSPAYPNPFNTSVRLSFQVNTMVNDLGLQIFNLEGELVNTLANGIHTPGIYETTWSGTNSRGELQASGLYILKLSSGTEIDFQRITLLR